MDKKLLVAWLNNAYAMEREIVEILKGHLNDAKGHTDIEEKIGEHLDKTEGHSDKVKQCLDKLGEKPNNLKTGIAKLMGVVMGESTSMMEDKLVKNAVAEFATENLEIATYQVIHTMASMLEEDEIAEKCNEIIQEEIEMAEWLQENLSDVVAEVVAADDK
jgi:ferritin-like metal-binding protein YciE